jgi:hypothetical protein
MSRHVIDSRRGATNRNVPAPMAKHFCHRLLLDHQRSSSFASRMSKCEPDIYFGPSHLSSSSGLYTKSLYNPILISRIIRIGSRQTNWAIERDGVVTRSHTRAEVLGTYLDAVLAGANEFDARDIAKAIERRPRPSY